MKKTGVAVEKAFLRHCLLVGVLFCTSCSNQAETGSVLTVSADSVIVTGKVEKRPLSYCGIQYSFDPDFNPLKERRARDLGKDRSYRLKLSDLVPNTLYY